MNHQSYYTIILIKYLCWGKTTTIYLQPKMLNISISVQFPWLSLYSKATVCLPKHLVYFLLLHLPLHHVFYTFKIQVLPTPLPTLWFHPIFRAQPPPRFKTLFSFRGLAFVQNPWLTFCPEPVAWLLSEIRGLPHPPKTRKPWTSKYTKEKREVFS